MKDINDNEIKVGDIVKTQQYSGSILPPSPAQIGIVELKNDRLYIKYKNELDSFNRYILLEGQINEILKINDFQKWLFSQGYTREYGISGAWLKDDIILAGSDLFYKMEEWKKLASSK